MCFCLPLPLQDFPKIATFLPGRTVQEVVRLYYAIQVGGFFVCYSIAFFGLAVEFCLYHAIQMGQRLWQQCMCFFGRGADFSTIPRVAVAST